MRCYDGMSIAYFHGASGARVLFATRYHALTCLEGVKNYSMTVSEGKEGILFILQVVPEAAGERRGY